ncbi:MAG TPA: histidine phosphatase family protein [Pseudonocardia sp.]|jgi:broad specificity phosphatase PhoE|uniref:histidine phosphatase family protein n=1 Tax=Pseudonocardia sp. TaxID=60912 RepID=UPI002ED775BE
MRVVLLCHAATSAIRTAAFAGDEPLDELGLRQAAELVGSMPRADQVVRAPSQRCKQTAAAAGLDSATPDAGLAGCDFGAWTGRTLDELVATVPDAVTAWLTDPAACPHGGESLSGLLERVARWLDGVPSGHTERGQPVHTVLAVADPAVIRAAVVHAIDARPRSIWRIDVAPLSQTVLSGSAGRWSLRSIGFPTERS